MWGKQHILWTQFRTLSPLLLGVITIFLILAFQSPLFEGNRMFCAHDVAFLMPPTLHTDQKTTVTKAGGA